MRATAIRGTRTPSEFEDPGHGDGTAPAHRIPMDLRVTGPVPRVGVPLAETFVRERTMRELIREANEQAIQETGA